MYRSSYEAWGPDTITVRDERRAIVRGAVSRLPESYRVVVEMRDLDEFSTSEVAAMLDMTEGAVRVRLHRGRQALRALLEPYFKG